MTVIASKIKNKIKREEIYKLQKSEKRKEKISKRLFIKKSEKENPELKAQRLEANLPNTLENTREFDETIVQEDDEVFQEEETDEFSQYFNNNLPPKILVTTSRRPSAVKYPLN